jgi:hypothetical protein
MSLQTKDDRQNRILREFDSYKLTYVSRHLPVPMYIGTFKYLVILM